MVLAGLAFTITSFPKTSLLPAIDMAALQRPVSRPAFRYTSLPNKFPFNARTAYGSQVTANALKEEQMEKLEMTKVTQQEEKLAKNALGQIMATGALAPLAHAGMTPSLKNLLNSVVPVD